MPPNARTRSRSLRSGQVHHHEVDPLQVGCFVVVADIGDTERRRVQSEGKDVALRRRDSRGWFGTMNGPPVMSDVSRTWSPIVAPLMTSSAA